MLRDFLCIGAILMTMMSTLSGEVVRRAGLDIGSGSIKILVGDFELTNNQLVSILYTDSIPLHFIQDLNRSGSVYFSEEIIQEAIDSLKNLIVKTKSFGPMQYSAYATQAFREAANGEEVLNRISLALGFPMKVISQSDEALIGLRAIATQANKQVDEIISFDIGGGSFQIATLIDDKIEFSGALVGRHFFHGMILKDIQSKPVELLSSIHPVSRDDVETAIKIAKNYLNEMPDGLKGKLNQNGGVVEGIGAMHGQLTELNNRANKSYTRADVLHLLETRIGIDDEFLTCPMSPSEKIFSDRTYCVSDLIFLLVVMDHYGINRVNHQKIAGGASGLIVSPQYWEK